MGRPRQFDEAGVLDAAAQEFRVNGFADTSTERLCEVAGVNRSSLYNTFHSKEELFRRALTRYVDTATASQLELLTTPGASGIERVEALLSRIVDEEADAAAAGHAAGCMVVATLTAPGIGEKDEAVAEIIGRDVERRIAQLADAVRLGQLDGSIDRALDPDAAAWFVNGIISGARVNAQAGATVAALRAAASIGLRGIAAR